MNKNKILYSLNVEDVQNVSMDTIGRELNLEELKKIETIIGERINWYDTIAMALPEAIRLSK